MMILIIYLIQIKKAIIEILLLKIISGKMLLLKKMMNLIIYLMKKNQKKINMTIYLKKIIKMIFQI